MKTSCGIIIVNEQNEILMGHVTGNKFFDIPKGMLEDGEDPLVCALRECKEETSIELFSNDLIELGLYSYNKEKNLHLFIYHCQKSDFILENLVCTSMFEHFYSKKMVPEVDGFKWINLNEIEIHCAKSMAKLLNKLNNENLIKKSVKKLTT